MIQKNLFIKTVEFPGRRFFVSREVFLFKFGCKSELELIDRIVIEQYLAKCWPTGRF